MVLALGGPEFAPIWGLGAEGTLEAVWLEQPGAVDDIVATNALEGIAFVQAKRGINSSDRLDSKFGEVVANFVKLYLNFGGTLAKRGMSNRKFDPNRDRLVLAVGRTCSSTITIHLRNYLDRLRPAATTMPFAQVAQNTQESEISKRFLTLARKSWNAISGKTCSEAELREFCRAIYIDPIDPERNGSDETSAKNWLRHLLSDKTKDGVTWGLLLERARNASAASSGFNRADLVTALKAQNIPLGSLPVSIKPDADVLRDVSTRTAQATARHAFIRVDSVEIRLRPEAIAALHSAAMRGSVLLIGQPGAGKTGLLNEYYLYCVSQGVEALFLRAQQFIQACMDGLPGTQRDLLKILEAWTPDVGMLIVDGLDNVRGDDPAGAIFDTMVLLATRAPRWHVVASIREFDLNQFLHTQSQFLQLFPQNGSMPTRYTNSKFQNAHHFMLPLLTVEELQAATATLPRLASAVALPRVGDLLRVPFNLDLMASLVNDGLPESEVRLLGTQVKLLDMYWHRRVDSGGRADVLTLACEAMIHARRTQFYREDVSTLPAAHEALTHLSSNGVLNDGNPLGITAVHQYSFSHNLIFDFAVAVLVLSKPERRIEILSQDVPSLTTIAPSIRTFFAILWDFDPSRQAFWSEVLRLASTPSVPSITQLIPIEVATSEASREEDVAPLLAAFAATSTRTAALAVIMRLGHSLQVGDVDYSKHEGSPWAGIAETVAANLHA